MAADGDDINAEQAAAKQDCKDDQTGLPADVLLAHGSLPATDFLCPWLHMLIERMSPTTESLAPVIQCMTQAAHELAMGQTARCVLLQQARVM